MDFEIVILPSVHLEMDEYITYYDSLKVIGLGNEFNNDFLQRLINLQSNPNFYSFYMGRFRRIRFKRFPYMILYEVEEFTNLVIIHFVVPNNTNPRMIEKKIFEQ
jgi:hypothetical protein